MRARSSKKEPNPSQLKSEWQERAKVLGVEHPQQKGASLWGQDLDYSYAAEHLSERQAVFKRKHLELQTMIRNLGKASFEDMTIGLAQRSGAVVTDRDARLFTTHQQLSKEEQILQKVRDGQESCMPLGRELNAHAIAKKRGYCKEAWL